MKLFPQINPKDSRDADKVLEERLFWTLNYLITIILIAFLVVLLLHRSSSPRTMVFGRWSLEYFLALSFIGSGIAVHFLLYRYTRVGRRLFSTSVLIVMMSSVAFLGIAEIVARVFEPPSANPWADHVVHDELLVRRILPNAPGHDSWGWRNSTVPAEVDIVFIGDSQTYGNGVSRKDIFSEQFGRMAGKSSYNLALGGYGPLEYYWLYQNYGKRLQPQFVAMGLFLGNDLVDVVQFRENVADFGLDGVAFEDSGDPPKYEDTTFALFDVYLSVVSRSEPVYNRIKHYLIKRSALLERTRGLFEWIDDDVSLYNRWNRGISRLPKELPADERWIRGLQAFLPYEDEDIETVLTPVRRLIPILSDREDIDLGIALTELIIAELDREVSASGGQLVVFLIPTKEEAYYPYLQRRPITVPSSFEMLMTHTRSVRNRLIEFMNEESICVVDITPDIQSRAIEADDFLYQPKTDGHLSRSGHLAVAEALLQRFDELEPTSDQGGFCRSG